MLHAAATEPIALTLAVLVFGAIARLMRPTLDRWIERLLGVMSAHWIYFMLIVALGLLSSVITAVIAALILVEAISLLNLDRKSEIAAVVLACSAIGLGAALTPVGEPLGRRNCRTPCRFLVPGPATWLDGSRRNTDCRSRESSSSPSERRIAQGPGR